MHGTRNYKHLTDLCDLMLKPFESPRAQLDLDIDTDLRALFP